MGKRLPTAASLEIYAHVAADRLRPKNLKSSNLNPPQTFKSKPSNLNPPQVFKSKSAISLPPMESPATRQVEQQPLAEVVEDCDKRWFQDTLKEARAGDTSMQVLVAQMYQSGYGVPKNDQKARVWIEKASKYRSSALKVRDKRPDYNASDSDSEEEA